MYVCIYYCFYYSGVEREAGQGQGHLEGQEEFVTTLLMGG